jgi:AP-2 complex subunit mu-1
MDHGYPQITATNILTSYIKNGSIKENKNSLKDAVSNSQITSKITGSVDWREPGKYKYRKNEVYIDVFESVNLLMSNKGVVLKSDVSGKIVMKTFLSGMPECKFGMNDKLVMETEAKKGSRKRHGTGIAIDDLTFHRYTDRVYQHISMITLTSTSPPYINLLPFQPSTLPCSSPPRTGV